MSLAPIVLFVYNRLWHTRQTIEALQRNELARESELFIYSDGPRPGVEEKVKEVREYLKTIQGFKSLTIIERDKNVGLANNIIEGVTNIVNKYGRIIVLEDDMVTSSGFLTYMNEGLQLYANEERVASIHGYIYPVKHPEKLPETFFIRGADCWGWATWTRAWRYFEPDGQKLLDELKKRKLTKEFDFGGAFPYTTMLKDQIQGKNNSWAIRWHASIFLRDMLTLYPRYSLVQNIGMDNSGTHCGTIHVFDTSLVSHIVVKKIEVKESFLARKSIKNYLRYSKIFLMSSTLEKWVRKIFGGK